MHGVWVYPFKATLRHPIGLADLQNESGTASRMSDACLMVDDIWCSLSTAVFLCLAFIMSRPSQTTHRWLHWDCIVYGVP
ncbi:hypothetical protein K438DRAFT_1940854 [Mycena galopus ATCC 62051]|nr:hypothetical protein K438DRAFT_1940854 [Mycena galopus ATCC 62051]